MSKKSKKSTEVTSNCVTNNDIRKFFKISNETTISSITSADMALSVEVTSALIASTSHEHVHQSVCIPNVNGTNIQTPQEPCGTIQVENNGCMEVDGKCHKEQ